MPNYRYNMPENMRRSSCGKTVPAVQNSARSQDNICPCDSIQPQCCDNTAAHDELSGMPIAMAYVPWQEWRAIYEVEKGFQRGTIFEELDKPFKGTGRCCR